MSIVLNECAWAEDAIRAGVLGKKPYETFSRVAKYYTYNNYTKTQVRQQLDNFLLRCEPAASLVTWSDTLDAAAKSALKYPPIMIDHIAVTVPEMNKLKELKGKQLQRLAFTLLCIAKYKVTVNPLNNNWVTTPDAEIMKMANINTSIKRQSLLYNQLMELGMIRFSKKIDNLSVQVLFAEDGDTAMEITDFRNLGYQYMMYYGEPYFKCEWCGVVTKINSPAKGAKPKYCPDCAKKIKIEQTVNSVMRQRNKAQIQNV